MIRCAMKYTYGSTKLSETGVSPWNRNMGVSRFEKRIKKASLGSIVLAKISRAFCMCSRNEAGTRIW